MSLFKRGLKVFIQKTSTFEITEKNIDKSLSEFRIFLIKNGVAVNVAKEIIKRTKTKQLGERATRFSNMQKILIDPIKESILEILTPKIQVDLLDILQERKADNITKPLVILFIGINGTGKTTSIAKIAFMLSKAKYRLVIAAADTFRPGAQEQIKEHADRLKVKCIQGKYGANPASVAYDAIQHATARRLSVVLIDTAGRMAINHDLIEEMRRIKQISEPDITFLVADALTGNDAVTQAHDFNEKIGIDASILSKVDADEKSGASLSIIYATGGKPISYIGVGQSYKDLKPFKAEKFVENLFHS